jgi:hypothetical protein
MITANDIINFFKEKPSFNRETSSKYGWSPTEEGLYSLTDIYTFFEDKGKSKKEIDDIIFKEFKGKPYNLKSILVKNFFNDYERMNFNYYYFDITIEEAFLLKKKYEKNSLNIINEIKNNKKQRISLSTTKPKQK